MCGGVLWSTARLLVAVISSHLSQGVRVWLGRPDEEKDEGSPCVRCSHRARTAIAPRSASPTTWKAGSCGSSAGSVPTCGSGRGVQRRGGAAYVVSFERRDHRSTEGDRWGSDQPLSSRCSYTSACPRGLGPGLAIVRDLAARHGARVEAASYANGRGAIFRTIPRRRIGDFTHSSALDPWVFPLTVHRGGHIYQYLRPFAARRASPLSSHAARARSQ
jgi:hypothetical protein